MRWVKRSVVALIVTITIVVAVGWRLLAGSRPEANGVVTVTGLSAPVTLDRDAHGVPTITARNRDDLAYALGFAHGQERFFQMDLERRSAAGELAALVGPAALAVDESHRKHRFRALAQRELAMLAPRQRKLIDAYTAGVNAGLARLSVRPWQYLLLGVRPRPWQNADTILAIDAMFLDLNQDGDNQRELNIARLRAELPKPLVGFLLAPSPVWEAPMQGGSTPPTPVPAASVFDVRDLQPRSLDGSEKGKHSMPANTRTLTRPPTAVPADEANSLPGSNGFAVGGALTGGRAMLANDPHLALRVPNIWYRARLRYPDPADPQRMIELNGVTLPGAPAMVIGSNGHIA